MHINVDVQTTVNLLPSPKIGEIYDVLQAQAYGLTGITELLAAAGDGAINSQSLYFLLAPIERQIQDSLNRLNNCL